MAELFTLPPLPPAWEYKPAAQNSVLERLKGVTQVEDLPVTIVDGDADVYLEIVHRETKKPLIVYEHLIMRLNAEAVDGKKGWPTISVFVSTHVPGRMRPEVDLAGVLTFKPPLDPDSADTPVRIVDALDSRDAQPLLSAIFDNMRLAPYFKRHVPKTPVV